MEKVLRFCCLLFVLPLFAAVQPLSDMRNADVVRQQFEESCGAAALATLINMIDAGQKLDEASVLDKLGNTTDMVSFSALSKAASELGYENAAYKMTREVFEKLTVPLLVKVEDDPKYPHFIVVLNHVGDFVTIFDPSFGRYVSTKREFYRIWDLDNGGYGLILRPKRTAFAAPSVGSRIFFEMRR